MFSVKARSFRIRVLVVELEQALQVDMMKEGIAKLNFASAGASDAYYLLKSTVRFLSWCLPMVSISELSAITPGCGSNIMLCIFCSP